MHNPGFTPEGPFRVPLRIEDIPLDELGAGALVTPERILAALAIPTKGLVVDLDPGRFRGMPRHPLSPPFQLVTYRTPRGIRNEGDIESLRPEVNSVNTAWIDELMIGTVHIGAHIDALSHVTQGSRSEWYGGFSADTDLGDSGPLKADASKIPPIITRGVLLDIPGAHELAELPPSFKIRARDIELALRRQSTELRRGDVVLVRTGLMQHWPDRLPAKHDESGLVLEAARMLTEKEPVALGCDTSSFEIRESPETEHPQPVHAHVLIDQGIYIMEWLYLEELARREMFEFLFICLPLKIQGATGSWVRPVAIT